MKKILIKKIYLWQQLFLALSIFLLIISLISYFFVQNIIKKQLNIFISEDIEKEKLNFIENLKIILEENSVSFQEKYLDKFAILKKIQDLLNDNKYIVSCSIFLNKVLLFSYNKRNSEIIPMPPPPMNENTRPPFMDMERSRRFNPPKLKDGFFIEQYIYRTQPLKVFTINIIFYHEAAKKFLEKLRYLFIGFYILLLIITVPLSFLISKQFTKPIRDLAKKTINLSNGNYEIIIENKRKDELSILIDAFNKLAYELNKDQQFRKRIISEITHDIATPINIIRSYIYGLKDGIIDLSTDTIMSIDSEIERINELVDQINLFSSKSDYDHSSLPLLSISEELDIYIDKILYLFNKENIKIIKDIEQKLYFKIRRNNLRSLIENLIKNSILHNDNLSKILEIYLYSKNKAINFLNNLKLKLVSEGYSYYFIKNTKALENNLLFSFILKDNGNGISSDELPLIFDRFYKAKNSNNEKKYQSKGLGLSIVKEICLQYNIQLEFYSLLNTGSVIILSFLENK